MLEHGQGSQLHCNKIEVSEKSTHSYKTEHRKWQHSGHWDVHTNVDMHSLARNKHKIGKIIITLRQLSLTGQQR
jgi:hypothetical protein